MIAIDPQIQIKVICDKCNKNSFTQWIFISSLSVDIHTVPYEQANLNYIHINPPGDWFTNDNIRNLLNQKQITQKVYYNKWGLYKIICPECIKDLPMKS